MAHHCSTLLSYVHWCREESAVPLHKIVPNLRDIQIFNASNVEECEKLNNIEKLEFRGEIVASKLYPLITKYGSNLTQLSLHFETSRVSAIYVLNLLQFCPKLKKLKILFVCHNNVITDLESSSAQIILPDLEEFGYFGPSFSNPEKPNKYE